MLLIDRYIIRQFLINFVILLFVLIALVALIDLVGNLDEFLHAGRQAVLLKQAGAGAGQTIEELGIDESAPAPLWPVMIATARVVLDWHGPMSVLLYVYLSGLAVVAAMGFTYNELVRKGEIVAVMTSGVSMFRIAAPILLVGGLLNVAALPIQEWVIPPMAGKLARSHHQAGQAGIDRFQLHFARDAQSNLLSAAAFDPEHDKLTGVHILVRDQAGSPQYIITANEGHWDAQRGGYHLIDGYEQRPLSAAAIAAQADLADAVQVDFFATSLSPQVLIARRAEIYPSFLSIVELHQLRRSGSVAAGLVDQIIHQRFSMLVINMLVLIMGLPFFLCREPVNLLVQATCAAALCLGAWGTSLIVLQMGRGQFNPVLAAWLPVVLYLPLSAWFFQSIKT